MVNMKKAIFITLLFIYLFLPGYTYAQQVEKSYEGTVRGSEEVECSEGLTEGYTCFEYLVEIDGTKETERTIPVMSEGSKPKFKDGDRVYISQFDDGTELGSWSITGYIRELPILILLLLFAFLSLAIGRRQGLGSLLSLVFTVFLLYSWAIPKILAGGDVMVIGIITVFITLILIMYLSHGFKLKTTIAAVSTMIGISIVAILAKIFMNYINVDGSGSEEAFLLSSQTNGSINLSEVFFISILIGAMGVMDDVVMSQVSSINELYTVNRNLSVKQLYSQAMNIGRDHIASMINTLFIAYAGTSFALVMLLTFNTGGVGNILKTDVIAEEIVRTFTASIGILLIVPITTIMAAWLIPIFKPKD